MAFDPGGFLRAYRTGYYDQSLPASVTTAKVKGKTTKPKEEPPVGTLAASPEASDTLVPEEPTPLPDATTSGGGATGRAITKRPVIRK